MVEDIQAMEPLAAACFRGYIQDMRGFTNSCLPRIVYGVLLVGLVSMGFYTAIVSAMLFAFPFWFAAALLIAVPLAGWLSSPVGGIFFPRERLYKKQPMYSIPESLRMQNKIHEAFDAYQEIAREYPREVRPYIEMIRLAHVDLKRDDLASAVHHRGLSVLRKKKDREELRRMYDAVVSLRPEASKAEDRRVVGYRKGE